MKYGRLLNFILSGLVLLSLLVYLPMNKFILNLTIETNALTISEVTDEITNLKNTRYKDGTSWLTEYSESEAIKKFNGSQCVGFARNLANIIFGCFPNTSVQYVNDGTINNGWKAIKNISSVQPGDIIHVYNHAAMVWYLDGDTVYVAEAWGNQNSKIKYGYFNGSSKNSTLAKIKMNNTFYGIWRYTNTNNKQNKPTWSKVTMQDNRTEFEAGEQIKFNLTSDYGKYYNVYINRGSENIVDTTMAEGYDLYCYVFNVTGDYTVCVTAYNESGFAKSDTISFKVVEKIGCPTWATLSTQDNRTVFGIGEQVQFSMNSDNAKYYVIGIDYEGERIVTSPMAEGYDLYCYGFNFTGNYTAYVSAYNGNNWVDSNIINFKVVEDINSPTWAKLSIKDTSEIFDIGQQIQFNMESDNATYFVIGIDRNGERILTQPLEKGVTLYSYQLDDIGTYTAYVSAYNGNYWVDSNIVNFKVITQETSFQVGDCNNDGELNTMDIILLQKWLLTGNVQLANWQSADLNQDGILNIFDFCLLKQMLIHNN